MMFARIALLTVAFTAFASATVHDTLRFREVFRAGEKQQQKQKGVGAWLSEKLCSPVLKAILESGSKSKLLQMGVFVSKGGLAKSVQCALATQFDKVEVGKNLPPEAKKVLADVGKLAPPKTCAAIEKAALAQRSALIKAVSGDVIKTSIYGAVDIAVASLADFAGSANKIQQGLEFIAYLENGGKLLVNSAQGGEIIDAAAAAVGTDTLGDIQTAISTMLKAKDFVAGLTKKITDKAAKDKKPNDKVAPGIVADAICDEYKKKRAQSKQDEKNKTPDEKKKDKDAKEAAKKEAKDWKAKCKAKGVTALMQEFCCS